MTQLSGAYASTNQLKVVARWISFGRVGGGRPAVEFDARVGRHARAGVEIVLLHAFAIEFVAGA